MGPTFFAKGCLDLANNMLSGYEHVEYTQRQELALVIQQAIEDWFMGQKNLRRLKVLPLTTVTNVQVNYSDGHSEELARSDWPAALRGVPG